jgi:YDG domain/MBG domain (YGX type)/Bacterial Ig domain
VTSVTLTSSGAAGIAAVAGSPYSIAPSAAVGTGLANYSITYATGQLTVNPAGLTITADNQTKIYGQTVTFAGTEFTAGGLVNGDTVTSVTLTSSGAAGTATVASSPYSIAPSAAVGPGLANYSINYQNGTLTVTAKVLAVASGLSADDKVYDRTAAATLSSNNVVLSGIINGDGVDLDTNDYTAAFASSSVANNSEVTVAGLSLSGTAAGNYALLQPVGLRADITPATVTVVSGITANNKVFDGTTSAALSSNSVVLAGVVSGDTVDLNTNGYTATFASPNVGNDIAVTVVGLTLVDADAANYTLTQPSLAANITPVAQVPTVTCPANLVTNSAAGLCGQTVPFTVTVNGTPPPVLTYQLGSAPITSPFFFPMGTNVVICTAINSAGTDVCSFLLVVLDSQPPLGGTNLLGTTENVPVNAPVVRLLAGDQPGPRGGTLSLTAVTATSVNGGTVALNGTTVTYTPRPDFVGLDRFTYTLSDGCGTAQATVLVTVLSADAPSFDTLSITPSAGTVFLEFAGIPAVSYVVQSAPAMTGPWADCSPVLTADATGLITYTDATPPPIRFYRTRVAP